MDVNELIDDFRSVAARCTDVSLTYFEFLGYTFETKDMLRVLSCIMAGWMRNPNTFKLMVRSWTRPMHPMVKCIDNCKSNVDVSGIPLTLIVNSMTPDSGRKTELIGYSVNKLIPFIPCFQYTVFGFESSPMRVLNDGFVMWFGESEPKYVDSQAEMAHNLFVQTLDGIPLSSIANSVELNICLKLIQYALDFAQRAIGFTHYNLTPDNVVVKDLGRVRSIPIAILRNDEPLINQTGAGLLSDRIRETAEFYVVESRYIPIIKDYSTARAIVTNTHLVYTSGRKELNRRIDMNTLTNIKLNHVKLHHISKKTISKIDHKIHLPSTVNTTLRLTCFEDLDIVSRESGTASPVFWEKIDDSTIKTWFNYGGKIWSIYADLTEMTRTSLSIIERYMLSRNGSDIRKVYADNIVEDQLKLVDRMASIYTHLVPNAINISLALRQTIKDNTTESKMILHDMSIKHREIQWFHK